MKIERCIALEVSINGVGTISGIGQLDLLFAEQRVALRCYDRSYASLLLTLIMRNPSKLQFYKEPLA